MMMEKRTSTNAIPTSTAFIWPTSTAKHTTTRQLMLRMWTIWTPAEELPNQSIDGTHSTIAIGMPRET